MLGPDDVRAVGYIWLRGFSSNRWQGSPQPRVNNIVHALSLDRALDRWGWLVSWVVSWGWLAAGSPLRQHPTDPISRVLNPFRALV